MDLQYIRRVVKIVNESGIQEIEIEQDGKRLRVTRAAANSQPIAIPPPVVHVPAHAPGESVAAPVAIPPSEEEKHHKILSPIVGTFYHAPAPDAEPYVRPGSVVSVGSPLCIIEAMKIMNEIESDVNGTIVKILIENGQPVEYNQPLFLVNPA